MKRSTHRTKRPTEQHFAAQMDAAAPRRTQRWWIASALAGAICFTIGAPIVWWKSREWTEAAYISQLVRDVELASPDNLQTRVAMVTAIDDVGIAALVELLASERAEVTLAASRAIDAQLSEWQHLPPSMAQQRVLRLAKLLVELAPDLSADQRQRVVTIGEKLLRWPFPDDPAGAAELLATCEVLVTLPLKEVPDELRIANAVLPREIVGDASRERSMDEGNAIAIPPIAGSNLPVAPEGDDRLPTVVGPSLPPSLTINPGQVPQAAELGDQPREIVPAEPGPFVAPRAEVIESAEKPDEPTNREVGATIDRRYDYLTLLADLEVMQRLSSTDEHLARAAEEELRARGYESQHLQLALVVVSSDPAKRLALAESLPSMRGIDPRPWLLHLATDADPAVRTTARAILKTTSDPALRR
nr:hypothetical protein [Pirellula staleyi]